ncbi:MAG: class IV adenylate cyclase, partial [Gammaproteobacteria bacterium]|nr:class IV adenylate cyclase [Gammaproteobacteria bacterium]
MPCNIEIKARLSDITATRGIAEHLTDQPAEEIFQRDTFFVTADGRLKLREFSDGSGQLIYYCREDNPGPSGSFYQISPTADPHGLRCLLSESLGVRGEVVKTRHLFMKGRTRIHIDSVQGLGDFLELEVVLSEEEDPRHGIAQA